MEKRIKVSEVKKMIIKEDNSKSFAAHNWIMFFYNKIEELIDSPDELFYNIKDVEELYNTNKEKIKYDFLSSGVYTDEDFKRFNDMIIEITSKDTYFGRGRRPFDEDEILNDKDILKILTDIWTELENLAYKSDKNYDEDEWEEVEKRFKDDFSNLL